MSTNVARPARLPVIFDDDGSPDGTVALYYLLGHPGVSMQAIGISFGEANPDVYIQHIGRKLESFGISGIPLGAGQGAPLAGTYEFPEGMREAADRFWDFPIPNADKTYPVQDAADLIVEVVKQAAEPVTIFVSGPCTNLAAALRLDSSIRDNIEAVYIMGGAVYAPGNISDLLQNSGNTVAEWNFYADAQAASEVLESGLPVYLVPLDATNQVLVGKQDTAQWRIGGATADSAAEVYDTLLDSWRVPGAAIWDLMTAAMMAEPELCTFVPLHLDVITDTGPTVGQTVVVDGADPNAHVCLEPDNNLVRETIADRFAQAE